MFKKKADASGSRVNTNGTSVNTSGDDRGNARNARASRMRESLYRSKSDMKNKSMYLIVILPDKPKYYIEDPTDTDEAMEINDWLAENTVDFLNELQVIYGILSEGNEEWKAICDLSHKDENQGYPKNVQYKWKAANHLKPKQLPIDSYIDHVLFWCTAQVENEAIFPTEEDEDFPKDFDKHLKKLFQRMFRVFAVIWSNPCLCERKDVDSSLPACFKHFMFFAWKWGLMDGREELTTISGHTKPLREMFDRDEKLYRQKKLPIHDD